MKIIDLTVFLNGTFLTKASKATKPTFRFQVSCLVVTVTIILTVCALVVCTRTDRVNNAVESGSL